VPSSSISGGAGCSIEIGSDAGKGVFQCVIERRFLAVACEHSGISLAKFVLPIASHFGYSGGPGHARIAQEAKMRPQPGESKAASAQTAPLAPKR